MHAQQLPYRPSSVPQRPALHSSLLLRGTQAPPAMYDAGEVRLILESLPSLNYPTQKALYGAVLFLEGSPAQGEGTAVQLLANGEVVGQGIVSPFGSFFLDNLPLGSYRLTMRLPALFVVIEQVVIEP